MKIVNKKNIVPVICVTYTFVSVSLTAFEVLVTGKVSPAQLNLFLFLIFSILGVGVLSQHYRLERFSPVGMLLIQYLCAIGVIFIGTKIAACFVDIHPNGLRDLILSFSVPYVIGAAIYYISLWLEVNRQNQIIRKIKESGKKKDC